ncbi:MAG TPA: hypothetical protein VJT49_20430 [Amycolatopsis sp.]|uniref:hypothetical protein n=1 Tax=Amycolatopsis sp. TaxID=37632 RepID=UPI002B48A10E|nr:hypothetical protein [Amycolatopsis sp.]HKS47428.1 hypothetical protein [Amycolatopsis sp.]
MAWTENGGTPQQSTSTGFLGQVGAAIGAAAKAVETGVSKESLAQAQQAAQGLKDAASSGKIRITENGFSVLMNALTDCENQLLHLRDSVYKVAQAPRLGSSPYAQTVSGHVQKGGTGETQSADAVVDQLGEVLNITRDALNQARKAYQDNEHGNVQVLK